MEKTDIKRLLDDVAKGALTAAEALDRLSALPFVDMGFAKHDGHRPLRNGFAEVIFCEGKRPEHVKAIVADASTRGFNVLGTRADGRLCEMLVKEFHGIDFDEQSRTFRLMKRTPEPLPGRLAVLAAGTADLAVAEEACRTAQFFGVEPNRHYDVGIAGLHRLLSCVEEIRQSDALIVVAGMEGALPGVVGGLVGVPIIAVPTSIGYGASFKGIAALLGMLNTCSEGISVVNIDNGFGAACAAIRILRMMRDKG